MTRTFDPRSKKPTTRRRFDFICHTSAFFGAKHVPLCCGEASHNASIQNINLYKYVDQDLTIQELYFCLMVEETMKQLGVQDVYGVIFFLLGRPNISTRAKVKYAIQGTSVASTIFRALLDIDMPFRMPTRGGRANSDSRISGLAGA
ncbi:hypothetical protein [Paraburkholderia adhaesiva]|uniref:hypothetical protein n=1 Tax=Paraburkholderia adhaesiva TaxID=2883244 RepID=UPI001F317902|nr:hypothetical protein [Paraburkholderia adhaesiva]